jgi:hypothetical protein
MLLPTPAFARALLFQELAMIRSASAALTMRMRSSVDSPRALLQVLLDPDENGHRTWLRTNGAIRAAVILYVGDQLKLDSSDLVSRPRLRTTTRRSTSRRRWSRTRRTIASQKHAINRFIGWCDERRLEPPAGHHAPDPRALAALRLPLPQAQWHAALGVRAARVDPAAARLVKWMTKQNHILYNPAADLDLPTRPKALSEVRAIRGRRKGAHRELHLTRPSSSVAAPRGTFHPG